MKLKNDVGAIAAGGCGLAIETYDFVIYGVMSTIIAALFFPEENKELALLFTYVGLAVGNIMRPLGSILFGVVGDRFGRRPVLIMTVITMTVGTSMIGLLPTYAQAGLIAPILLASARLIQGFATGGESTGSITFIVEYAKTGLRGFYGSWQQVSSASGVLAASLMALLVTSLYNKEELMSWAWRIPFLISLLLGVVALYLRINADETPVFKKLKTDNKIEKNNIFKVIYNDWRDIIILIAISVLPNVIYLNIFVYTVSLANSNYSLPLEQALLVNSISLTTMLILVPIAGYLSDKYGRRPFMAISAIALGLFAYPGFLLIEAGGMTNFFVVQIMLSSLLAFNVGPWPAYMVELTSNDTRARIMAISYSLAFMLFGGTTPMIQELLVKVTGFDLAGSFWIIAASAIYILFIYHLPETAYDELCDTKKTRLFNLRNNMTKKVEL